MRLVLVLVAILAASCALGPRDDPLTSPASTCDAERVAARLEDGADPNGDYRDGVPMFIAAAGSGSGGRGCLETLQLMVAVGGDPTQLVEGRSILAAAAAVQAEPAVVDYLIEQGADPCSPLNDDDVARYGVSTLSELARQENSPEVAAAFKRAAETCPSLTVEAADEE